MDMSEIPPTGDYAQYPRGPQNSGPARIRLEIISEAWNAISRDIVPWILAGLIALGIIGVLYGAMMIVNVSLGFAMDSSSLINLVTQNVVSMAFGFLYTIAFYLLNAGFVNMALKTLQGETIVVTDLFQWRGMTVPVIVASLLSGIFQSLGVCACFVGSFVVGGLLILTIPLILDQKMDAWTAIKTSYNTLKSEWLMAGVMFLVITMIIMLSMCVCVGPALTIPLSGMIYAMVYRDYFWQDRPTSSPTTA